MGEPTVANILMGPVKVWYAPVGETQPADSVAVNAAWGGNWEPFGFTKAPLKCGYDVKEVVARPQESLAPVKRRKSEEDLALETAIHEFAGEYLGLAFNEDLTETPAGPAQVEVEYIEAGGHAVLDEYAWGFEGVHVDDLANELPMRFFLYKGTAKINGDLEFGRAEEGTGVPFQVNALADWSTGVERLFKWQRVTAPATGS